MTMGVYAIRNTVNGKRYIGSSVDIERRAQDHARGLNQAAERRLDADMERELVRDWIEFGQDAFEVDVLEVIEPEYEERETVGSVDNPAWRYAWRSLTNVSAMRKREWWYINNTPCEYNRARAAIPAMRINYPTLAPDEQSA